MLGNSLEFINVSAFSHTKNFDELIGVYVNDDLSVIFELNQDGYGNYTKNGKGVNFECLIFDNILQCIDVSSDNMFYLEFNFNNEGILIKELPIINNKDAFFENLTKIR